MDIKVDLNPEDVQRAVTEAVVGSFLGQKLKQVVNDKLADLGKTWDSALENQINVLIREVVMKQIEENYTDKIRDYVVKRMTDEMIDSSVGKIMDRLKKDYY